MLDEMTKVPRTPDDNPDPWITSQAHVKADKVSNIIAELEDLAAEFRALTILASCLKQALLDAKLSFARAVKKPTE